MPSHGEAGRKPAVGEEAVERGRELAAGEIAVGPENYYGALGDLPSKAQRIVERVPSPHPISPYHRPAGRSVRIATPAAPPGPPFAGEAARGEGCESRGPGLRSVRLRRRAPRPDVSRQFLHAGQRDEGAGAGRSQHPQRGRSLHLPRGVAERIPRRNRHFPLFRTHDVQRRAEVRSGTVRYRDGAQRRRQQRVHHERSHRLHGLGPAPGARTGAGDGGRPHRPPQLRPRHRGIGAPGSGRRAAHHGGQQQRWPAARTALRHGLRRASLPVADHRLGVRHRRMDRRRPGEPLPHRLRAQQLHGDRRGRRACRGVHRPRAQAPGAHPTPASPA